MKDKARTLLLILLIGLALVFLNNCYGASTWAIPTLPPPVETESPTLSPRVETGTPTRKAPKAKRTKIKNKTPKPTMPETGSPRVTHGPVVGAVTAQTARIFARTNQPASVKIRYGASPDLSDARETASIQTEAVSDFTAQVPLNDLTPNTRYFTNVIVNGQPQFQPPYPTFKSFPPEGAEVDFSFVVLTDFFWHPTFTFRNAAKENPDFVIIGGDFSHSNPNTLEHKRGLFKKRYDRYGELPSFVTEILDKFAVAHFWDDHDYGVDDGDKTYPNKQISLQVLQEFFPVYSVTAFGDWQKFSYGNADFFLLDARSQRDPKTDPDDAHKSMLDGDNLSARGQYEWLINGLSASKAKWKFILTPVTFNPTVPKKDSWTGYKTERNKLVNAIKSKNIQGVMLISADLHAGALDDGTNSDFPEMLVPAPNYRSCLTTTSPGLWSAGVYAGPRDEPCNGYGVVKVQTKPPRVTLTIKNQDGLVMLEQLIHSK